MQGVDLEHRRQLAGAHLGNQLDKLFAVAVVACVFGLQPLSIPAAYYAYKARELYRLGTDHWEMACKTGKRAYYLTMFSMTLIIATLVPAIVIGGAFYACCRRANTVEAVSVTSVGNVTVVTSYHNYERADREAAQIEQGCCCAATAVATMGLYWWCHTPDPLCLCPWDKEYEGTAINPVPAEVNQPEPGHGSGPVLEPPPPYTANPAPAPAPAPAPNAAPPKATPKPAPAVTAKAAPKTAPKPAEETAKVNYDTAKNDSKPQQATSKDAKITVENVEVDKTAEPGDSTA